MGNEFQYQILHQAKLLIMYESRIKFFKYLRTEILSLMQAFAGNYKKMPLIKKMNEERGR